MHFVFATQHYIKQPSLARLFSSLALLDTDSLPGDCWDQDKRQQRTSHCRSSTSIDRRRCLARCCISPPCNTCQFVSVRYSWLGYKVCLLEWYSDQDMRQQRICRSMYCPCSCKARYQSSYCMSGSRSIGRQWDHWGNSRLN